MGTASVSLRENRCLILSFKGRRTLDSYRSIFVFFYLIVSANTNRNCIGVVAFTVTKSKLNAIRSTKS